MKTSKIALGAAFAALMAVGCANHKAAPHSGESATEPQAPRSGMTFDADSAMSYIVKQCDFGPRVPGTPPHSACGSWLESELRRHGAEVTVQNARLSVWDGTKVDARNIIGSYNPDAPDRLLLLAHWDTRPVADEDPVEANRTKPVVGANDGASGVGVLLEIARQMSIRNPGRGIDILFCDVEDMGRRDDDQSWALGARYFAEHPFRQGYTPSEAILLDMVGGAGAMFAREYFSMQSAPDLVDAIWSLGQSLGYSSFFSDRAGGAVTDDHVELIRQGVRAIDIIEYNPSGGFNRWWHTTGDTPDKLDRATLKAVGQTLTEYIYR